MKIPGKVSLTGEQWQIYKRLLQYLGYYKGWFALGAIGALLFALAMSAIGVLTKSFFDGTFGERDPRMLFLAPTVLVLLFLVRGLGDFSQTYFMGQVSRRVVKRIRADIFDLYLHLPIGYYDRTPSSELLSRLLFQTEQMAQAATESVTTMIRETLTLIGLLATLFYLNAKLALIIFAIAPPVMLLVNLANRYFRRYSARIQNSMVDITRVSKEAIEAPRAIRVFNAQDYQRAQFELVNESNRRLAMKLIFVRGVSNPVVQLIAACALSVVLYIAVSQALDGTATMGSFTAFMGMVLTLMTPLRSLTNLAGPLQQGITAAQSVFALLDEPREPQRGMHVAQRVRGEVEFRGVALRYGDKDRFALDNISLKIEPGEVVAFVGQSGSGKSTLVNLLPRFYDATAGTVLVDGHDVRDYTLASLRDQIALVSQEVVLFDDTIRANIAFGRDVSDADIRRVAGAAHVLEFADEKPAGLLTRIGDRGMTLSGGQRQRISIARALLKDAPILILDEATSALDNESERRIQAELEVLMRNRTTLVIAHRLSTVEKADRIVVMNQGRIAEIGTHVELLAKNGQYAALHRMAATSQQ
jgi:ATP-binding cassette, subfamily B, bacterial MsbA